MKSTLMKQSFSVTAYWDSRVVDDKGLSRIMLTINLQKQFRTTIKLKSTKADFDKAIAGKSVNDGQRQLRRDINAEIQRAETILETLKTPTKELFLSLFKSNISLSETNKTDVYSFLDKLISDLYNAERFSSSINAKNCRNSFKGFKSTLYFQDITPQLLKDYKEYMKKKGSSESTANIHIRTLRSLYKDCIEKGIVVTKENPFEKISVGYTVRSKSVLYPEHLKLLWEYKPELLREIRAKDFFFFCYLGNGMNFWDMANLKNKDVEGDYLSFIRSKTSKTTNNPKQIRVYLNDEMQRILSVYRSKSDRPNDYLFEIFNNCRDAAHHFVTFGRYKGQCNRMLKIIRKKIGLQPRVYLGIARHSFATKHKLNGTPTSFISEWMGHTSTATTEHYLKTLPDEQLKNQSNSLLNF